MKVMTLCKDGVPVNSILVDEHALPELEDGYALHDPQEVPFLTEQGDA